MLQKGNAYHTEDTSRQLVRKVTKLLHILVHPRLALRVRCNQVRGQLLGHPSGLFHLLPNLLYVGQGGKGGGGGSDLLLNHFHARCKGWRSRVRFRIIVFHPAGGCFRLHGSWACTRRSPGLFGSISTRWPPRIFRWSPCRRRRSPDGSECIVALVRLLV